MTCHCSLMLVGSISWRVSNLMERYQNDCASQFAVYGAAYPLTDTQSNTPTKGHGRIKTVP